MTKPKKPKKKVDKSGWKKNRYGDWAQRLAAQNPSTHASRTAPED